MFTVETYMFIYMYRFTSLSASPDHKQQVGQVGPGGTIHIYMYIFIYKYKYTYL